MKVTVQTAVATLRRLRLQLQQQVMPVQTHLHVLCARAAAAATSEQLEAVATDSAVHVILQDLVVLFPVLRGCDAACMLRLSCFRQRACIWSPCAQHVTCRQKTNVFSVFFSLPVFLLGPLHVQQTERSKRHGLTSKRKWLLHMLPR
jgi:hypothetical protein